MPTITVPYLNIELPIYVPIALVVVIIGWIIVTIITQKNRKKYVAQYLEKHPNSARVYLKSRSALTQEVVQVWSVDGEKTATFSDKLKYGIYVKPGTWTFSVNYTSTRPGVMYKSVTKTTGFIEREFTVEANGSYLLSFDTKAREFVLGKYDK